VKWKDVNMSVDQIRALMDSKEHIRNMSVIAHIDHGKSTLTDSLVAKAGITATKSIRDSLITDTCAEDPEKVINVKSVSVPLYYEVEHDGKDNDAFLINLIDCPGHVDFSSEVTAALRVTDGALVVVDCIEGVCVQTETVLRQAIAERILPVLFINKLDRVFLEQKMEPEQAYQTFRNEVESVNTIISTYNDEKLGDVQVYPEMGTVAFGSGLHQWGFTLEKFGALYADKWGITPDKMMKSLWGENFFNPKTKKWAKMAQADDGTQLTRGFTQFIMQPLMSLFEAIMNDQADVYNKMLKKLNINLPADAGELTQVPLLKKVMQTGFLQRMFCWR
jgi:elongation factor 2